MNTTTPAAVTVTVWQTSGAERHTTTTTDRLADTLAAWWGGTAPQEVLYAAEELADLLTDGTTAALLKADRLAMYLGLDFERQPQEGQQ